MTTPRDPIFLFGALRSGSTLLRLMVKNHPDLWSPGEADFLFDHLHADPAAPDGWRFDTDGLRRDRIFRDKEIALPDAEGAAMVQALVDAMAAEGGDGQRMTLNIHRNAPKLAALFPDAQILHLIRDPRDVAKSAIGMGWAGNGWYGVTPWIDTEAGWDAAGIDPARVLDVRFEELMVDVEVGMRRICDFLGLPFSPEMLDYHRRSSFEAPDPNIAAKWKVRHDPQEIGRIEARIGPLLEARGFERAYPRPYPGAVERLVLSAENRARRWRHNVDRYGAGLFFGRHAAGLLGLKTLRDRLDARQEDIRVASRK